MDIDYSQGINIPVNFNQLINNTATRANIQDYYYVYKRHINPRYEGSKVYAANFNYYTPLTNNATFADGETQQNWNGDTIPGEITVGNPLTYFAYFDWIGGTPNEYFNGSGVKLKFLINEKGETFPPSLSSPYYYNLIGSFEQNTTAIISQINTTPGQPNNTEWPILYPGKSPYPIIYSQTGSTYTTYPTLSFFPGNDISIPNYEFNVLKTTPQAIFSPSANSFPGIAIGFDTSPVTPSSNILWNSAFEYITASSATNTQIKINSSLTFKNNNYEFNPGVLPVNIVLQIQSCPTFGFSQSTTTVVSQLNFTLNNLLEVTKNISSDYFYPTSGTFYRIAIYWNSNSPGVDFEITEGSLYITQNPSSNLDVLLGSGYFSTGSSSKNWLTGSISFTQNIYGRKQISIPNSGYFDPLPFDIKVGDYIRFEADENKTYYIKSILPPSDPLSNGILKIELDKEIQTNTDINSFLIRRWENDPSFIILNNINASNIEGPGIIYPKYLSQDIKNKIPSIIQDLSNKGLI
jgi:hypothetical protein